MFGPTLWRFGGLLDPFREIQRLQRDVNRLFSDVRHPAEAEFPPVNIWLGDADGVVTAELPGADPQGLDISVVGDTLTISGAREAEQLKEGEAYHRQERNFGAFKRTLKLPFQVDANKVKATYERGILEITLSRAEEDKPRRIAIQAA